MQNGVTTYEAPGANDPNTIYTMNYAGNNNTFNSFDIVLPDVGTVPFEIIKNLDFLKIQRKDNPEVQGIRDILWFDGAANGTTININSGYNSSMDVALRTPILNLGTDNVFTNTGNPNNNNNNIERIDFIEPGGLISPTTNENIGFVLVERGKPGLNDPVIITPILGIDEQNKPTEFGGLINISDGEWGNSGLPDVIPQITRQDANQDKMRWSFTSTTQSIGGIYVSFADLGINPGETFYGYAIFPADVNANMDLIGLSDVPLNTNQELGGLDVITGGLLASALNIAPTSSNNNVTTLEDTPYSFVAANFPFTDLNTGDTLQQVKITSLPTQGTLNFGSQAVTINQIISIAEIGQLNFSSPLNANGDNYANFSFQVGDGTDFSGNYTLTVNVTPVNDAPEINDLNNNPSYILGENPVVLDNNAIINDVELDAINNYAGSTLTLSRDGAANPNDVFSGSGTLGALTPGGNLTVNGAIIGTVTNNSGGQLSLTFTNATATQVDTVLQQIAYSNSGDTSETVTINYSFNDGNTGSQGTGGALTATGSLTVNINTPPNQPPTATNDTATTQQDIPVTLTPLNNDTDPEGDNLIIESVNNPNNGTVNLNPNTGEVVFTPTPGYIGPASFEYTVNDGNGGTSTATANITVNAPPNQVPTATNDTATTQQDIPVTLTPLNNDTDPEGDNLIIESVNNPNNGTVNLNPDTGEVVFTPTPGYIGPASFEYTVNDGNGGTSTATANITVEALPNQPPILVDDTATTQQDIPVTLNPLNNDTDPNGDNLTIASVNNPNNGTVNLNPDTGEVVFTPTPSYIGPASFEYTVNDGNGGISTATVNITVDELPNQPPILVDDTATTQQDTPVTLTPLNNDTDPEGDNLTIASVNNPNNGTVNLNPDTGEVVFTPTPGYIGPASFEYTVNDGNGGTSTATANITVEALPNQPPILVDDTATTQQDIPVTLNPLNNDTDPNGDNLTIASVNNPNNGTVNLNPDTGEVVFTPTPGYIGPASFEYTVNDGNGGISTATVNITVDELPNQPPILVDDTATTQQDTPVTLTPLNNDTDPEGDNLTIASVNNPNNGTVNLNPDTGEVVFTPTPGYIGPASFEYTVNDGNGGISTATVNITVDELPNQPPILVDDTATTQQDTPVTLTPLNNDTDPEGDNLTIASVNNPNNGTVNLNPDTGEVVFTPTPGYIGPASFEYTVNDGNGGTSTATANITVEALPNQPPILVDDTATTQQDIPVTLTPLNNDTDPNGDNLIIESVNNPNNGTVNLNPDTGEVVFTPTPGYIGPASFEYTVNDGNGGISTATANITVDELPTIAPLSPPVFVPDDECDLCPPLPELPSVVFPERPVLGLSSPNIATTTINGTNENDSLLGTPGNDNIFSFGGDDVIDALPGNDNIYSGDGDDSVDGGEGTAWIEGGKGNDQLRGSFDNDTLQGQEGNDSLFGGIDDIPPISGRDITGQDWLSGGTGDDFLSANENNDTLTGDDGNDIGYGGKNNDLIFGDKGNDSLYGDENNDTLIGSVTDGTVPPEGEEEDVLYGYENNDLIQGGIGKDTIYAGEGDDFVFGGQQDDLLRGELGRDTVYGDEGNDTLFGGYFPQDMMSDPSEDLLWGGTGDDVLYGNLFNDTLIGGEGNDTLYGGEDDDILYGENGDDLMYGDQGSDIVCGGDGDDTLYGGTGETGNIKDISQLEQLEGGAGNDILSANEGMGELCGDEGNDTLYGGKEADTLKGGANDDWLFSDLGNDSLTGGSGSDRFVIAADTGLDQITDFQLGQDLIVLNQGLTFSQLTLTQDGTSALISFNNQPLVKLNNIQAELISSNAFEVLV
uniref:Iron-regulated protein FrpC n=1 Tax=Planktothrix pseudagardhii TaxID=132604 RepID=A0A9W4CLJ4_9CYAN|nr:Iron-regulated protein FrpC [Planktothrix pseudagardhii]